MKDAQLLSSIGNKVKFFRKQKEMTQIALAKLCKTDSANISRLETGKDNASILTLKKICTVLNIDVFELFND